MSQFPIILIPTAIQRTKIAQPPVSNAPSFPVLEHPGDAPAKIDKISIGIQSAIAVILSFIIGNIANSNLAGTLILIGSFGAICFGTWQQFNNYPQRKKEHQERVTIYRRQKEEVEKQKQLHYERVQAEQTPEKIAKFRYQLLLETLSSTNSYDGNHSKAPIGITEKYFYSYLKKYFKKKIHTKLTLDIPNFDYPYSPDFAYIDKKTNLHIDIEIDEPYAYNNKQPTHYLGYQKDERRNQFFLERYWVVIRFSEEQIVNNPESCCKTVAETIADLLDDNSILKKFRKIPSLPLTNQWTYNEAEEMAMTEYRKTYLKVINIYIH